MHGVRLEDGAAGFLVAELDRLDDAAPSPLLFADALVDQHVGVHRGADGQDEAGDTRQRQRRVE